MDYGIEALALGTSNKRLLGVNLEDFRSYVFLDPYGRETWTEALQAAIDSLPMVSAAPLIRNGVVTVPLGDYRIGLGRNGTSQTVNVPMGVTLKGLVCDLSNNSNLTRQNGSRIIVSNTTGATIKFQGQFLKGSGCALRDLIFTGGGGKNCDVIVLDDIFYMSINGCTFEHLDAANAVLCQSSKGYSCNWIFIEKCTAKIIGDSKTFSYGRGFYLKQCADSYLINCVAESCGSYGFNLGSGMNKMIGCWGDLSSVGLGVFGTDNMIMGSSFKSNFKSGIVLGNGSSGTQIIGCKIFDNNASRKVSTAGGFGIDFDSSIQNVSVNACHIGTSMHGTTIQNGGVRLAYKDITAHFESNFFQNNQGPYGRFYDPNNLIGKSVMVSSANQSGLPFYSTGERPGDAINGQMVIDSTLGKLVWFDKASNSWKDAMGNVV